MLKFLFFFTRLKSVSFYYYFVWKIKPLVFFRDCRLFLGFDKLQFCLEYTFDEYIYKLFLDCIILRFVLFAIWWIFELDFLFYCFKCEIWIKYILVLKGLKNFNPLLHDYWFKSLLFFCCAFFMDFNLWNVGAFICVCTKLHYN